MKAIRLTVSAVAVSVFIYSQKRQQEEEGKANHVGPHVEPQDNYAYVTEQDDGIHEHAIDADISDARSEELNPDYSSDESDSSVRVGKSVKITEPVIDTNTIRQITEQRPKLQRWNLFGLAARKKTRTFSPMFVEHFRRNCKIILAFFLFLLVLFSAVVSKICLLMLTSTIRTAASALSSRTPYISSNNSTTSTSQITSIETLLNASYPTNNASRADEMSALNRPTYGNGTNLDSVMIRWYWALVLCICTPYVLKFLNGIWRFCFRKNGRLTIKLLIVTVIEKSCRSLGVFLLVFIVLPSFDVPLAVWLIYGAAILPSFLLCCRGDRTTFRKCIYVTLDILSFIIQLSILALWTALDIIEQHIKDDVSLIVSRAALPISLFLISISFWENFITSSTVPVAFRKPLLKLKREQRKARYKLQILGSAWSCAVIIGALTGYFALTSTGCVRALYYFSDGVCFDPDMPEIGLPLFNIEPLWIVCVQTCTALICYTLAKSSCKVMLQILGFSLPLILAVPITFGLLMIHWQVHLNNNGTLPVTLPYPLLASTEDGVWQYLLNMTTTKYLPVVVAWWLSLAWITVNVWSPRAERLAKAEKLFVEPMYCGILLETGMLLGRRRDEREFNKSDKAHVVDIEGASLHSGANIPEIDNKADEVPKVYVCATMWHETRNEMLQIMKSLFRLDVYQHTLQMEQDRLFKRDTDFFEFEAHIFFDDAFEKHELDEYDYTVNKFVKQLVDVVDIAAQAVHEVADLTLGDPTKIPTPYGGQLTWRLPGSNSIVVHLKDREKIRIKKRWSQVMYMYYFLGYGIMEKNINRKRKQKLADNTFILALDGDVDFEPAAVQLLLDHLKKDPNVGAACGRIHPVGSGPLVWYQKFEYAVGHWLQKATEHMIGCVLCSPGCFSMFRGSALMDNNVMRKYTTPASEGRELVQWDQGEDRWLCTLLLQQGYRVEYSAAADARTFAPETLDEFYNQRRRWTPSTMANIIDLLGHSGSLRRVNNSISIPYIVYQSVSFGCSIIAPGTIFLLIVGAVNMAYVAISLPVSLVINLVPLLLFTIVCFVAKPKLQVQIATILSGLYAMVMVLVLVGLLLQISDHVFCSLITIFFFFVVGTFIISAILHPLEMYCFLFSPLYFLAIPCMSMMLFIYSICNMHVVSWGTREVVKGFTTEEEPGRDKQSKRSAMAAMFSELFGKLANEKHESTEYTFSFGNLFRCFCCPKKDNNPNRAVIEAINERLEYIEETIIENRNIDSVASDAGNDATAYHHPRVHVPSEQAELPRNLGSANPLYIQERQQWRDELVDPAWAHDPAMGSKPITLASHEETGFWMQLIRTYLDPQQSNLTDSQKKSIAGELRSLRNKVTTFFFLINGLYIVAIFTLQLVSAEENRLAWNVTCTLNEGFRSGITEGMEIQPLSVVFMAVFGVLLFVQLFGMLAHRASTLMHVLSSIRIRAPDRMNRINWLDLIADIQKYQPNYDDDGTSVTSEAPSEVSAISGGEETPKVKLVKMLEHRRRRGVVQFESLSKRFDRNMSMIRERLQERRPDDVAGEFDSESGPGRAPGAASSRWGLIKQQVISNAAVAGHSAKDVLDVWKNLLQEKRVAFNIRNRPGLLSETGGGSRQVAGQRGSGGVIDDAQGTSSAWDREFGGSNAAGGTGGRDRDGRPERERTSALGGRSMFDLFRRRRTDENTPRSNFEMIESHTADADVDNDVTRKQSVLARAVDYDDITTTNSGQPNNRHMYNDINTDLLSY